MKVEALVFGIATVFLALVTPAYVLVTDASSHGIDWTGAAALTMTTLLAGMVTLYLGFHARKMDARPEDNKRAEIADGAGELGFFPPYSWWPLWCSLIVSVIAFAIAAGTWWLVIIAAIGGIMTLIGWVFEYYRGEFAH